MKQIHAYAVRLAEFGESIVNAVSAGQAKVEKWREVRDAWPDVPYTAMRARKVGRPHTSEDFARCAARRGFAGIRCGQRVRVGTDMGTIVGHNNSSNFDVHFDDDAHRNLAGQTLNVHPGDCQLVESK